MEHKGREKPEKEECKKRRIPKEWNRIGPQGKRDIMMGGIEKVTTLGEKAFKRLGTIRLEHLRKGNTERENITSTGNE